MLISNFGLCQNWHVSGRSGLKCRMGAAFRLLVWQEDAYICDDILNKA